jgi:hypothetical protein
MPKQKSDARILKAVEQMDPNHQACRDTGHTWHVAMYFHSKSFGDTLGRRLVCTQCHTQKTTYVNRITGEVLARNYNYAPGYQLRGFQGEYRHWEVSRLIRVSVLARAKVEEVEEE